MIRHSSLPKLAQCACYESASGESSPAAARGTKMDEAFRFALSGDRTLIDKLDADEDKQAVIWAVDRVIEISEGKGILSDESKLKVKTPGIDHVGTEDCRIPSLCISCDLKSGQVRDYENQMMAYAYGNMAREFCDEWTCYVFHVCIYLLVVVVVSQECILGKVVDVSLQFFRLKLFFLIIMLKLIQHILLA